MDVQTFVARQNVARFQSQLENGAEGKRRRTLVDLLVEEENKLGLTREQLEETDRQIVRIGEILAKQIEAVEQLKASGQSMERAERAISNLIDLLAAHEAHRARIEAVLPIRNARP